MLSIIELWHKKARPKPTEKDLNVQMGCHIEEFIEMLDALVLDGYNKAYIENMLTELADGLKGGSIKIAAIDPKGLLDALCDQVVTASGVGHCAHVNVTEGVRRVNSSNWSKFVNGEPVFHKNGKIAKPDTYQPPDLEGLY